MDSVELRREVLDWAAQLAGQSLETFASTIAKREKDRRLIAEGRLTARQAERLAKAARIPFGFLFLSEPPELVRPAIPDLRQTQDALPLSDDFYDVLEDAINKQEWFAQFLEEHGAQRLSFVGKFSTGKTPTADQLAKEIIEELQLTDQDRRQSPDPDSYFSKLSAKAEAKGIMVLKTGYVKSFTKRTISEKEFRGFALPHPVAPLVFVNGNDAKVAAVFTLFHEIAHIWMGVSGVSDVSAKNRNPVEQLCNATAANILVPLASFNAMWKGPNDLVRVAKHFRVSRLVIARRALEQQLVDQAFYDDIAESSVKAKKLGSPTIDLTLPVRNGKRFTRTVIASAMSGDLLLRDAANLLNVRADTVASLGSRTKKSAGGNLK